MKEFQLREYTIRISEKLYPIMNADLEEIMVVYPDYSSVCARIGFSETGRLAISSFWGVLYELKGKEITLTYTDSMMQGDGE